MSNISKPKPATNKGYLSFNSDPDDEATEISLDTYGKASFRSSENSVFGVDLLHQITMGSSENLSRKSIEGDLALKSANETKGNQLGTINGVLVPCMLNILGVVLFIRLGWGVGQAGWFGVIGVFIIAELQCFLTILSLSAIVTNGNMKSGGSYFMISRCLGPELGGAIGILFYIAKSISVSFYILAFTEELFGTWFPAEGEEYGNWGMSIGISIGILAVITILAQFGAKLFSKCNILLFILLCGSIAYGVLGVLFGPPKTLSSGGELLGPSLANMRANVWEGYTKSDSCFSKVCDYRSVFAILFPAVTGILEGSNLSGDLKNPQKSIPPGSLWSIGISSGMYFIVLLVMAASFSRDTLIINQLALQEAGPAPLIVVFGLLLACTSSSLGAIMGGSRILQAIAIDNLFPMLTPFSKGSAKTNEPRRAILMTFLVSGACIFYGDVDLLAPLISCFFCLCYAFVNFACYLVVISGTPNFRPKFKYFSWHTSLLGFIMNFATMFYLNWAYGFVALLVFLTLVAYLIKFTPDKDWGDVRQAIIFTQVKKYLLQLDTRKAHGKTWRPSILLLVDDFGDPLPPLMEFSNDLKRGGIFVLGTVICGQFMECNHMLGKMHQAYLDFMDKMKLRAFPQIAIANNALEGFQNLMVLSGLGALSANTVVVPLLKNKKSSFECAPASEEHIRSDNVSHLNKFYETNLRAMHKGDWNSVKGFFRKIVDSHCYINILQDCVRLDKILLVSANFDQYALETLQHHKKLGRTIDIWLTDHDCTSTWEVFSKKVLLLLQLAYILQCNPSWPTRPALRVFRVISFFPGTQGPEKGEVEAEEELVWRYMNECRFQIESIAVIACPTDDSDNKSSLNELMATYSYNAYIIFLPLPPFPSHIPTRNISNAHETIQDESDDYVEDRSGGCEIKEKKKKVSEFKTTKQEEERDSGLTAEKYIRRLNRMTLGLPPVALVATPAHELAIMSKEL